MYRRYFSSLLKRGKPAKGKASNETKAVIVPSERKYDFELEEKLLDTIITNDSEN